ncbi:MAG: LysR family transcriptional regulator, partial [Burkholderiales bacterium]|nr:LysR family transcriptional regulator [Burkholderiales bacterium]
MGAPTSDLNLWVVFNQLMRTRQVSRAALALGLSQPAVSNALARLRRQLGDPLFVRTPTGMQPTPRAEAMAPAVHEALTRLQEVGQAQFDFEPMHSTREFRLGLSDIGEIYFLPPLMQGLAGQAPGVSISTLRQPSARMAEALADGQLDLAIGLLPQLQRGFYKRQLFTQRYVCLMRAGHPLAGAPLTAESFQAAEHLRVLAEGTGHGQVDEALARHGLRRRIRLSVPHFVAVGHLLAGTDLLATVPERLAESLAAPFGLVQQAVPAPLPSAAISLYWHARQHQDAANRWLRDALAARFGPPDPKWP